MEIVRPRKKYSRTLMVEDDIPRYIYRQQMVESDNNEVSIRYNIDLKIEYVDIEGL